MKEVGIFEAKAKFSELCAQVEENGVEYLVTRRGQPVARLVAVEQRPRASIGLVERMTRTNEALGSIASDEPDFPDVWTERTHRHQSPLEEK